MSHPDVTPLEALIRLGAATAEAVAQVLESFLPDQINRGEVTVLADAPAPFTDLPLGAIAASVSYVDGVTGANVFVMDPLGARAMATAMGVPAPEEDEVAAGQPQGTELSDLELSAVAEAANQMMAAAAAAISVVIGQEIEISPPDTRVVDSPDEAIDRFGTAPHATSTTFTIAGKTCRLIQLVPSTFVMRMARAIDEQSDQSSAGQLDHMHGGASPASGTASSIGLREALGEIQLRVWTELGRAQMPLGQALTLPLGAVVDLDRSADAPVDLFVNGLRFAQGHLLVTDDGEWAVELEAVGGNPPR